MVVGRRHGGGRRRGRIVALRDEAPARIPGLIADIEGAHVDTRLVPGIVAVSAVSLIGGASLGPEQALGSMGGGAATWMARRKGLDKEDGDANVLNGFAGAYGGLFSSTVIVVMLILEVARPGGQKFAKALVGGIIASSVSFGIYFVIVGAVFLDAYKVPSYEFEDWQLLAAIPLGLLAAVVATALVVSTAGLTRLFTRLPIPSIAKPTLGGAVFGFIGVALPLTLFTGSDQLKSVLQDAGTLGLGLLVAILFAKILAFAVSMGSGFVGGPIFPALFIGGTAGVAVHQAFAGVPLGPRVHVHVRRRPGRACGCAVRDGVDGSVHDPGRCAANRADPDRRRHFVPRHGGRQVPDGHAHEGAAQRSARPSVRKQPVTVN